jgi:hypothetical protein
MELILLFLLALAAFMFLGFWGGLFALLVLWVTINALKG